MCRIVSFIYGFRHNVHAFDCANYLNGYVVQVTTQLNEPNAETFRRVCTVDDKVIRTKRVRASELIQR